MAVAAELSGIMTGYRQTEIMLAPETTKPIRLVLQFA